MTTLLGIPAQGRHARAPHQNSRPLLLTRPGDPARELSGWLTRFNFRGSLRTLLIAGFAPEAIEWAIYVGLLAPDGIGYRRTR